MKTESNHFQSGFNYWGRGGLGYLDGAMWFLGSTNEGKHYVCFIEVSCNLDMVA